MTSESRTRRRWPVVLLILLLVLGAFFSWVYYRSRGIEERTRTWIEAELSRRFKSTVELQSLRVQVFPIFAVKGGGLVIHYHNRFDVPPLIQIKEFSFNLGLIGALRAPRHISSITLTNMVITIPPRQPKPPDAPKPPSSHPAPPNLIIDEIVCDDALLLIMSKNPEKPPLDFDIHNLVLNHVGADEPFVFHGNLTNAKPKGEIATTGKFGPWDADEPGDSPVAGVYSFTDADLSPFPGISGILSSTGSYDGQLNSIHAQGETTTPDFAIDPVGRPVPLHTTFNATIDGTDGDTYLHPVIATLGKSEITSNGSVVRVPSEQGHLITLDVTAPKARLEDILSLAVKADKPPLSGPLNLRTKLTIPPGKVKAIEKMILDGDFDAQDARFASTEVREKLESLSRHALGKPHDEAAGSALSDLKGHFHLEHGVITFRDLSFAVEGATILLDGTYTVRDGSLDFQGELRLQATVSETMSGMKSLLVKPFDPLFKKDGAGTLIPISITGNRENPIFEAKILHKTFKKDLASETQSHSKKE